MQITSARPRKNQREEGRRDLMPDVRAEGNFCPHRRPVTDMRWRKSRGREFFSGSNSFPGVNIIFGSRNHQERAEDDDPIVLADRTPAVNLPIPWQTYSF